MRVSLLPWCSQQWSKTRRNENVSQEEDVRSRRNQKVNRTGSWPQQPFPTSKMNCGQKSSNMLIMLDCKGHIHDRRGLTSLARSSVGPLVTSGPPLCHAQCVKGGGVRKMFFSEKTKGLFWSIWSSYWMFNLGVHVWVTVNKIMAKKRPFLAIFSNIWP